MGWGARLCHSPDFQKMKVSHPESGDTSNLSRSFFFVKISKINFTLGEPPLKLGPLTKRAINLIRGKTCCNYRTKEHRNITQGSIMGFIGSRNQMKLFWKP